MTREGFKENDVKFEREVARLHTRFSRVIQDKGTPFRYLASQGIGSTLRYRGDITSGLHRPKIGEHDMRVKGSHVIWERTVENGIDLEIVALLADAEFEDTWSRTSLNMFYVPSDNSYKTKHFSRYYDKDWVPLTPIPSQRELQLAQRPLTQEECFILGAVLTAVEILPSQPNNPAPEGAVPRD